MALFSQRKGIKEIKNAVQINSIDEDLRNGLWDAIKIYFNDKISYEALYDREWKPLPIIIWHSYFKKPIDTIPQYARDFIKKMRDYFFECEWYEAYDLIEFLIIRADKYHFNLKEFIDFCNGILKREVSAYRIIGDKISEITSEEEISEIEEALSTALKPVHHHLKRSLELLSDRKTPDYRNSIKEAISAVEAICKIITNDDKETLGKALKKIDPKIEIHPALKDAFDKLYGYTSDEDGIRHALLDIPNLDFEDAKFMLVSCSAFINYLKAKSLKAGIKF